MKNLSKVYRIKDSDEVPEDEIEDLLLGALDDFTNVPLHQFHRLTLLTMQRLWNDLKEVRSKEGIMELISALPDDDQMDVANRVFDNLEDKYQSE